MSGVGSTHPGGAASAPLCFVRTESTLGWNVVAETEGRVSVSWVLDVALARAIVKIAINYLAKT